jgi:hypothetical protein
MLQAKYLDNHANNTLKYVKILRHSSSPLMFRFQFFTERNLSSVVNSLKKTLLAKLPSLINVLPTQHIFVFLLILECLAGNALDLFGRFPIRIPAGTPATLAEGFHGFSQSFQANSGIVPRLDHLSLPSRYFPFHRSLPYSTQRFRSVTIDGVWIGCWID